jgi:hypothetical protein
LPWEHKALSSNPSTAKGNKQENKTDLTVYHLEETYFNYEESH